MLAAIFGLIGVIVGALVAAGSQLALERRREARTTRLACRLIEGELRNALMVLEPVGAGTTQHWPPFDVDAVLPTSAWTAHRAEVAAAADDQTWDQLVEAYAVFELQRAWVRAELASSGGKAAAVQHPETVKEVADKLREARAALVRARRGRADSPVSN